MGATNFAQSSRKQNSVLATANANRDGTGTVVTVLGGVVALVRGNEIAITPITTVTEGHITFFAYDGTNYRLIGEIHIDAWTAANTKTPPTYRWKIPDANRNLYATTDLIKACTLNAETFHVEASYDVF